MFKTSAKRLSTYGAQECSKTTSAKRDVNDNNLREAQNKMLKPQRYNWGLSSKDLNCSEG